LAPESRSKESKGSFKHTHRNVNYADCDSDSSNDESNYVYPTEFSWPSKAKSYSCDSLKPVHKNRQEEIKFTFDVAKCDKIFDEIHKADCIKMPHTIPPLDELKWKAYCRWHNSFSHVTNDCNVFHLQVQSAINEGRLRLKGMQVDKNLFWVNTIDLQNSKVLIRLEQAQATKGKNVVNDEKCAIIIDEKILSREVVVKKTADGKESLKITIKAPIVSGQDRAKIAEESTRLPESSQPVRPVQPGGTQRHQSD
jgi:hypothetical protein